MKRILFVLLLLMPVLGNAQSWQWGAGSNGTEVEVYPVATDRFGNVFCAVAKVFEDTSAVTFGSVSGPTPVSGTTQVVWVKFDSTGTPLWAGGNISGNAFVNSITTDNSGNLIVYGTASRDFQIGAYHFTIAHDNYFLAKISPLGTVLWVVTDASSTLLYTGCVTTDSADNIYITGNAFSYTWTMTGSDTLHGAVYVAKYTPSGALAWASSLTGTSGDASWGIIVNSAGHVYISGSFGDSSIAVGSSVIGDPYTHQIGFIAELSPSGVPLWGQAITGHHNTIFGFGLAKDADDNMYMVGIFSDTFITFGSTGLTMLCFL
jgi:hypothetical protein